MLPVLVGGLQVRRKVGPNGRNVASKWVFSTANNKTEKLFKAVAGKSDSEALSTNPSCYCVTTKVQSPEKLRRWGWFVLFFLLTLQSVFLSFSRSVRALVRALTSSNTVLYTKTNATSNSETNLRTSNSLLVGFVTQYRVLCRFRKLATCKTWLVTPKVTKEPNTPVPLACVKPSLTLKRVSVCRLAQVCLHQEQNTKRTGGEPTQFSGSNQPLRCVVTVDPF